MGTLVGNKQVVEFGVYEMEYKGNATELDVSESSISPISFDKNYYERYSGLINTCFYEMRKALNIQPYESYCADLEELMGQKENIFLLLDGDEIIGAVSCYENEIENLAVSLKYQRQGFGKKLMRFALDYMQKRGTSPIKLTVTQWNRSAIALYESFDFVITKETTVRGVSTKDVAGNWTFEFTTTGGLHLQ
jgi:GNAT superfamily N-acetyltransferase